MSARPRRMLTLLLATAAAGLCLQFATFFIWVRPSASYACFGFALAVACFFVSVRQLRYAFRPLVNESMRVQQMAIGWEPDTSLGPPSSLTGRDRTLSELERLRRELFQRLEHSQRLRVRAEQASAYKSGFLKSVQHELRTPLNAILGFAEVLLSGIEGPLTLGQRENLGVIRSTGKRLHDLFDEVIELAAAAAGEVDTRRDPIELGPILERIGVTLEEERIDKPAHIRIELADGLPEVEGDEQRITRLLRGIANQAFSVLSGPLLVITAAVVGEHVRVSVRDPGRKLSAQELASLLGREPTPVRRKGLDEGSRLRIALWRQLAELFGGSLELLSGERGTEYVLELKVMRRDA